MNKITHLFAKPNSSEFLRIILFDNNLSLSHIQNNKIINKIEIGIMDKVTILEYLYQHPNLPVDIIISNNTMSCRAICIDNLKEKDIVILANNILNKKDSLINFICYEKKLSFSSEVISFCEMKLTPILSEILQQILDIKNTINATITTPVWIVSNYFMTHPIERKKFKVQVFVIKTKFSKEIISLHDGKYVYYKHVAIDNFDEKVEVTNALDFVNQMFNVDLEDIAIYSLSEDTIDTFTTISSIDMRVISKFDELIHTDKKKNFNRSMNFFCSLIFLILCIKTAINIGQTIHYANKINKIGMSIKTVDSELIKDIKMWRDLDLQAYLQKINFKTKFIERMKGIGKKLQTVSVKIEPRTKQIIFNPVYEEK